MHFIIWYNIVYIIKQIMYIKDAVTLRLNKDLKQSEISCKNKVLTQFMFSLKANWKWLFDWKHWLYCLRSKAGNMDWFYLKEKSFITKHMRSSKNHTTQIPKKIQTLRLFYFNNAFTNITIKRKMQKSFAKLDIYFFSKHIGKKKTTKTWRSSY